VKKENPFEALSIALNEVRRDTQNARVVLGMRPQSSILTLPLGEASPRLDHIERELARLDARIDDVMDILDDLTGEDDQ
jgi:hypothetical protein